MSADRNTLDTDVLVIGGVVVDSQDAFPEDPMETVDRDGDGIGDEADLDDDGDGTRDD